ncbi:MAG: hypothetical protein WCF47_14605 [Pseudolabrys sp.]
MSTRWNDGNAPLTNFAVMHALQGVAVIDPASGRAVEPLMSATAQSDPDAKSAVDARPAVTPVLYLPRSIT